MGDSGVAVRTDADADDDNDIFTTDSDIGGKDSIDSGTGDDFVLGGFAGDTITAGTGDDIVIGDNGRITRDENDVALRIMSIDPEDGGNDTISGNVGLDILIGGFGDDTIYGNDANDTVTDYADTILGDNGMVVRNDGTAWANDIFTTAPGVGGNDTIYGQAGDDILIGGGGDDDITGALGYVRRNGADVVESIATRQYISEIDGGVEADFNYPEFGGTDTIEGNAGADTLIGGTGDDEIRGDEGDDIILGDNGVVNRLLEESTRALPQYSGRDFHIYSTHPLYGGADTIRGNEGDDIILGGSGGSDLSGESYENQGDDIKGNDGVDYMFGDSGYVTRNFEGTVTKLETRSYIEAIDGFDPTDFNYPALCGND